MQVSQSYATPSTSRVDDKGMHFDFSAELSRAPVSIHAMIQNSLGYGKVMLALRKVVSGDWRPPQKDNTAYQEWVYQRYLEELPQYYKDMEVEKLKLIGEKEALQGELKTVQAKVNPLQKRVYKARRNYYDWLYKHDKSKWYLLDPVISVHEDSVIFEAFSLDESSYGRVSVPMNLLETFDDISYGTTNIDFSQALADELYRVRSYRAAWLKVAYEQVSLGTSAGSRVEKKIDLPETWVRGFLQVQSASTMLGTDLTLSTNTLAEILSLLEQRKEKVSPRSLRFRLKKGECPSVLVEPWNVEVKEHAYVYQGETEGEIRIWGRRRLEVLKDLLPYGEQVHIKLLGTGMPSYWSVELEGHRFDLGLSGWTANDWAQKGNFDLLASTGNADKVDVKAVEKVLIQKLAGTPSQFAEWLNIDRNDAVFALQELCKNGQAMYDHLKGIYRWRQLLQKDIVLTNSEEDERLSYAVKLVKENKVTITEEIKEVELRAVAADVEGKKVFKPNIFIDADGRIKKATCTCGFFRSNKLRQGPCPHIMAATMVVNKG